MKKSSKLNFFKDFIVIFMAMTFIVAFYLLGFMIVNLFIIKQFWAVSFLVVVPAFAFFKLFYKNKVER